MTQASEALVRRILGETIDPHTGAPLADSLRAVGVDGARVSIDLQLGYPAAGAAASLPMTFPVVVKSSNGQIGIISGTLLVSMNDILHEPYRHLSPRTRCGRLDR